MGGWLYGVICLMFSSAVQAQDPASVICYLEKDDRNSVVLSGIPCTHVIYSYVRINIENNSASLDLSSIDKDIIYWSSIPQTKLIQIGGDDDKDRYSVVTSNPQRRSEFVQSIISFTEKYNFFEGVDLHWMNPNTPELRNYVSLVEELRKEYNGNISICLPNVIKFINQDLNIPLLNKIVDMFILPAYNFTVEAPPSTYHHSPLTHPRKTNITFNNVLSLTKLYLQQGIVSRKLVLGLPLFGRLVNSDTMKIENYELSNDQICLKEAAGGWEKAGSPSTGPLLKKGNQIISYDTPSSVVEKSKLAKELNLGGVVFWKLKMDYRSFSCRVTVPKEANHYWPNIEAAYGELLNKDFEIIEVYAVQPAPPLIEYQSTSFKPYTLKPVLSVKPQVAVEPLKFDPPSVISPYPPVANPPTANHPAANPTIANLPAATLLTVSPPSATLPASNLPAVTPPTVNPPSATSPASSPHSVTPPAVNPPIDNPPVTNPYMVEPPSVQIHLSTSDTPQASPSKNSNEKHLHPTFQSISIKQGGSFPTIKITLDDQDIVIENYRVQIKKKQRVIEINSDGNISVKSE